jgi:hypothetical protein
MSRETKLDLRSVQLLAQAASFCVLFPSFAAEIFAFPQENHYKTKIVRMSFFHVK